MTIYDSLLQVSNEQDLTDLDQVASIVSTDSIPLSQFRNIGDGNRLVMQFHITETVTSGESALFRFCVLTDSEAALDGGDQVVVAASGLIPVAQLTAGTLINVPLPSVAGVGTAGTRTYLTYLGARIENSDDSHTVTAGAFSARICQDPGEAVPVSYPSAYSVT